MQPLSNCLIESGAVVIPRTAAASCTDTPAAATRQLGPVQHNRGDGCQLDRHDHDLERGRGQGGSFC